MEMFHNYVNVYQMVNPIKIPLDPIKPPFSYSFPLNFCYAFPMAKSIYCPPIFLRPPFRIAAPAPAPSDPAGSAAAAGAKRRRGTEMAMA